MAYCNGVCIKGTKARCLSLIYVNREALELLVGAGQHHSTGSPFL